MIEVLREQSWHYFYLSLYCKNSRCICCNSSSVHTGAFTHSCPNVDRLLTTLESTLGVYLVESTDRRGSMDDSGKTRSSLLRRVVACVCCLLLGAAVARGTWFVHAVQRGARVVVPAPASESDPLRCTCENISSPFFDFRFHGRVTKHFLRRLKMLTKQCDSLLESRYRAGSGTRGSLGWPRESTMPP